MNLSKIKEHISSLDYSKFDNKKTAVIVTAFNRPQYYRQVVESINQSDELENIPIFIFLDGGILAKTKENIEISKNIIHKNKFVLSRNKNYGCDRGILLSLKMIFNDLKFDFCFVLEDDLVLGKNYFSYVFEEFKKIKEKDPNAGMFQGWNKCLLSYEEKKTKKDIIVSCIDEHFWGYILEKEVFKQTEIFLDQYLDVLSELPFDHTWKNYRDSRLGGKIRTLYRNILKEIDEKEIQKVYEKQHIEDMFNRYTSSNIGLGQDTMFELALFVKRKKRFFPLVNRAICVGEVGLHQYPGLWQQMNLDKVRLEEM